LVFPLAAIHIPNLNIQLNETWDWANIFRMVLSLLQHKSRNKSSMERITSCITRTTSNTQPYEIFNQVFCVNPMIQNDSNNSGIPLMPLSGCDKTQMIRCLPSNLWHPYHIIWWPGKIHNLATETLAVWSWEEQSVQDVQNYPLVYKNWRPQGNARVWMFMSQAIPEWVMAIWTCQLGVTLTYGERFENMVR